MSWKRCPPGHQKRAAGTCAQKMSVSKNVALFEKSFLNHHKSNGRRNSYKCGLFYPEKENWKQSGRRCPWKILIGCGRSRTLYAFLVSVFNVQRNLASSVLKRPSAVSTDTPVRHRNSSSIENFEVSIVSFLKTLADEVGDVIPNNMGRYLPHKSKTLVYMLYYESKRIRGESVCSRSHFYRTWKELAPQVPKISCICYLRYLHLFSR